MAKTSPEKGKPKQRGSSFFEEIGNQMKSLSGSLDLRATSNRLASYRSSYRAVNPNSKRNSRSSRVSSATGRLLSLKMQGGRKNRVQGDWSPGQKVDWWTLEARYLLYYSVFTSFLNLITIWQVSCE